MSKHSTLANPFEAHPACELCLALSMLLPLFYLPNWWGFYNPANGYTRALISCKNLYTKFGISIHHLSMFLMKAILWNCKLQNSQKWLNSEAYIHDGSFPSRDMTYLGSREIYKGFMKHCYIHGIIFIIDDYSWDTFSKRVFNTLKFSNTFIIFIWNFR